MRMVCLSAVLGSACALCVLLPASAQEVAPRLTGAMVVANLAKAQHAVEARAKASDETRLQAVAGKLASTATALQSVLGDDADEPVTSLGGDERDATVRAEAAAKRVQAWLDASAVGCTRADIEAMTAALSVTLDQLANDTSSQKAPLPVIDGIATPDKRPLFVLHQGGVVPRFVLTGENLVDARCANPEVVAMDAQGHPAAPQPRVVAAQPGRVELQWPDVGKLAPGSYTLRLSTQRKAFLRGCVSQPPAVAVLQVAPLPHFRVSYAMVATCADDPAPVSLGSATLSLAGPGQTVARTIDVSACVNPVSYTITAAARMANGQETKMGPVTQGPSIDIDTSLGNGLTLGWDPSVRQLYVRSGKRTCKGVY